MSILSDVLSFNHSFVENKGYEECRADKYPKKKMVIVSCMDTRLIELLPKSMGLKNGDAKIIKNAGAIVSHPFGSIMRSILVALYSLKAKEVYVIGHHDCGMIGLHADPFLDIMKDRGIPPKTLDILVNSGVKLERWLEGFESAEAGVRNSVSMIQNHPLLPPNTPVHCLIIHPETGKLDLVIDGYKAFETVPTEN